MKHKDFVQAPLDLALVFDTGCNVLDTGVLRRHKLPLLAYSLMGWETFAQGLDGLGQSGFVGAPTESERAMWTAGREPVED